MILQALVNYYERLAQQENVLPAYGWSWEKISYCIVLNNDGSIHHIDDLRVPNEKKLVPNLLMVPMLPEGKTSGVKANPLWDNSAYTLGLSKKPEKLDEKYQEFWNIFSSVEFQVKRLCEFITSDALTTKQRLLLCNAINETFVDKLKSPLTPENISTANDSLANAINSYYSTSYKLENFLSDIEAKMGSKYPLKKYNCPSFYAFKHESKAMAAMAKFYSFWNKNKRHNLISEEALDENFVFRLLEDDKNFVHECPEFTTQWHDYLNNYRSKLTEGQCLIEGDKTHIADLHIRIKGVDDAQSSGAYIVSFNKDSFESYGLKRGKNASVGTDAAFKYVTALNHLLRKDTKNNQRLKIGDAITVFWAESANKTSDVEREENFLADLINPDTEETASLTDGQQTASLATVLQQVAQGIPLKELRPDLNLATKFYVLGISPNAARLAIRFWYATTLYEMARNIGQHYLDLALEPQPKNGLPKIRHLTYATARIYIKKDKEEIDFDSISPQLAGNLARAVFTGQFYPQSLLSLVLMRMRLDGKVDFNRVALCKAVINREIRLNKKTTQEIPMSLDIEEKNAAYRMGRLFAVIEGIQEEALGKEINATIRDRYWGAASATPALVFPMLERNMMNHLAKIRKEPEKRKLAGFLDGQIEKIKEGMPTFYPKSLNLQEQGRFAIGYYHQRSSRYTRKAKNDEKGESSTTDDSNQDAEE